MVAPRTRRGKGLPNRGDAAWRAPGEGRSGSRRDATGPASVHILGQTVVASRLGSTQPARGKWHV